MYQIGRKVKWFHRSAAAALRVSRSFGKSAAERRQQRESMVCLSLTIGANHTCRMWTTRMAYKPAPRALPAFPDAVKSTPKTLLSGAGLRRRWKDSSCMIYEWDYAHGTVEKYHSRGHHIGEFDPDSGEQLKPAAPSRRIEP
jgi:hypothetical protein